MARTKQTLRKITGRNWRPQLPDPIRHKPQPRRVACDNFGTGRMLAAERLAVERKEWRKDHPHVCFILQSKI